jgi:hypothetical protein
MSVNEVWAVFLSSYSDERMVLLQKYEDYSADELVELVAHNLSGWGSIDLEHSVRLGLMLAWYFANRPTVVPDEGFTEALEKLAERNTGRIRYLSEEILHTYRWQTSRWYRVRCFFRKLLGH